MKKLTAIIAAGFLFIAYGLIGSADIEHEKQMAEQYAEMVCAGAWPDYENREPDCSGIE